MNVLVRTGQDLFRLWDTTESQKKTSKKKSFREVFFTAMFKANESRRSSASALVRGESGVAATAPGVSLSSKITAVDSLVRLTCSATFSSLIDGNWREVLSKGLLHATRIFLARSHVDWRPWETEKLSMHVISPFCQELHTNERSKSSMKLH